MNNLHQGESSSRLSIHPLKRRRGRPRKDPSRKIAHAPPGYEAVKQQQQHIPPRADHTTNTNGTQSMVGQAVTGVVEAAFDAGFMLNIRIGNSPLNFRGIVFKPGHFVPVMPENDVAPHLQMIKRNDTHVPIPVPIPAEGQVRQKRKYTSRKSAPFAPHTVAARGNVVPVVLHPVTSPNGPPNSGQTRPDGPRTGHLLTFGDKEDVHMAEPLTMLHPDRSIPVGQIFLGMRNESGGVFNEGPSEVGRGDKVKPMELADFDNFGSSETSDSQTENGKEALNLKSPVEDSGIVETQEAGNANEPFSTESLQTVSVTKPFYNYGTGGMTQLLQALQENMKENQVQFTEQPISGSKVEAREPMATDNDPKNGASVP